MVRKKKIQQIPNLLDALLDLCKEKGLPTEVLFNTVEAALKVAYRKFFKAQNDDNIEIVLNRNDGSFHIYSLKIPVEKVEDANTEISNEEINENNYELRDDGLVRVEVTPENFGRIAAQAAKQVIIQKIREAERNIIYDEFTNKDSELVRGQVLRIERGNLIIGVGKAEAILMHNEMLPNDNFQIGDLVCAYILSVTKEFNAPQVYLSRAHPNFLRQLLELEIPEIQDGTIEIRSIAREAGARAKIAVYSRDPNIEAVGSCIGQRSMRLQPVLDEIGEEKLDIVEWSPNNGVFIANSLSPAKVISVAINEGDKNCRVVVPDNQLSLAIGKEGQNARLAAKLTGWKIDIKSLTQSETNELPQNMHEVDISDAMALIKALQNKGK